MSWFSLSLSTVTSILGSPPIMRVSSDMMMSEMFTSSWLALHCKNICDGIQDPWHAKPPPSPLPNTCLMAFWAGFHVDIYVLQSIFISLENVLVRLSHTHTSLIVCCEQFLHFSNLFNGLGEIMHSYWPPCVFISYLGYCLLTFLISNFASILPVLALS